MKEKVERVWEYSLNNPAGFTLELATMQQPVTGYCVAYLATQGSHDRESLHEVVLHALEHEGYVGGWFNDEDGRYYFDSVRIFDKLKEAEAFAKEQKQIAYFDLATGVEFLTKG